MRGPLLRLEGVDAVGGGAWLLRDVSLDVAEGSTVALLGGAGAGKSLLVDLILGLQRVHQGGIRLAGRDVTALPCVARQRQGLRAAFQRPPVFPGLTVEEHLALATVTGSLAPAALARLLDYLPELEARLGQPVVTLDRFLLRLVDMARALLGMPRLLLVDELFPAIGAERAGALVGALARDGYTLLLADRYAEAVLAHADHGYVLAQGGIAAAGSPAELLADPRLLATCAGDGAAYAMERDRPENETARRSGPS